MKRFILFLSLIFFAMAAYAQPATRSNISKMLQTAAGADFTIKTDAAGEQQYVTIDALFSPGTNIDITAGVISADDMFNTAFAVSGTDMVITDPGGNVNLAVADLISGDVGNGLISGTDGLLFFTPSAETTYRQYFEDIITTSVTVTENGGVLPANTKEVKVFVDGNKIREGAGLDYTISGSNINFNWTLATQDVEVLFAE